MRNYEEHLRRIDRLLADARVPVRGGEVPTIAEDARRRIPDGERGRTLATHAAIAPAHSASEPEQAQRELDLAVALVLEAPQAAAALSCLLDDQRLEPDGVCVFACLLYLSGRDDAAQFWWQLAAGADSHSAAYCLCLHHRRYGEYRDAEHWRTQAAQLRAAAPPPLEHQRTLTHPLLPDHLREDLISQCHRGYRPRLPLPLESIINRFTVDSDDADFGEIPQPAQELTV